MAKMALNFRALCTCLVVALALCCEPLRCRASKPWEDKQKNVSSSLEFHTPKEVHEVHKESLKSFDYRADTQSNSSRRDLHGLCGTGNSIDGCWRCDPHWATNRQSLANCALGFGSQAIGGRDGNLYVVTDDSDDDVINPKPGTLRYGVIQTEPLWIIFSANMNIRLQEELLMNSYKTVDGRGHNVHISGGACFVLQFISHVIIHGVHIHDCVSTGPAMVRSSPSHFGYRGKADGDGVSIFGSSHIWVDHCYLSNCADGLIDAIELSSAITVTNNYFTNHDKVMLLGAHPGDTFDKAMQVTVAFNHFGPGLIQRMPRCRFGYFHVVNNLYTQWEMYAIGGSENPTILSECNVFLAPNNEYTKEVTKHIDDDGGTARNWQSWNWVSSGDLFLNGAFFTPSGSESISSSYYTKATSILAHPARRVPLMTRDAGPLRCNRGVLC